MPRNSRDPKRLSVSKPRLTTPLVRVDGELQPTTWDVALSRVAEGFAEVKATAGSGAFAMFSCSKSTNEMNYAAQKFSRIVLGSNNIDSCNRT
jgi:formate dehydrogenase (hydrogenase)